MELRPPGIRPGGAAMSRLNKPEDVKELRDKAAELAEEAEIAEDDVEEND